MSALLDVTSGSGTPLEQLLGRRPAILEAYRDFYGALWDEQVLPPTLLELARLWIAHLHQCDAELAVRHADPGIDQAKVSALLDWRSSKLFSPLERAVLEYAELIPWGHHQITDEQVDAIRREIGDSGFVGLNFAVTFFDANCWLRLLFDMPPSVSMPVPAPASNSGPLY